jgi:copper chaperone CopZ
MEQATYHVSGMTCDHCVRAVSAEVTKLEGVTGVAVDLPSGTLTVTSDKPLDFAAVSAAVDGAGYDVSV